MNAREREYNDRVVAAITDVAKLVDAAAELYPDHVMKAPEMANAILCGCAVYRFRDNAGFERLLDLEVVRRLVAVRVPR